jgi:uncharacterized protein (TIGR03086 family)
MSEGANRYRTIASAFTDRVQAVPEGAWDAPAPCDGWVARDVVRHLVEWVPEFFAQTEAGVAFPAGPSVDDDPVGSWNAFDRALQAALDDPVVRSRQYEGRMGTTTFEQDVSMFVTPDVLVHTWDLARAAGLDERLDATAVHDLLAGMEAMDEALLRDSGHYGARVPVPDDADEQTRLIAFTGRRP